MRALLIFALAVGLAHADPAAKATATKDDHGRHAMTAPEPGETMDHASMHALPIGTGAAADGGAWLRIDVTGSYDIPRVSILGQPNNPMYLYAGRIYRVMPHAGPLVWTPPGGKQGVVPKANLLPPTALVGSRH